jgi:hypothetical protein
VAEQSPAATPATSTSADSPEPASTDTATDPEKPDAEQGGFSGTHTPEQGIQEFNRPGDPSPAETKVEHQSGKDGKIASLAAPE